jgi:hypothetical protein
MLVEADGDKSHRGSRNRSAERYNEIALDEARFGSIRVVIRVKNALLNQRQQKPTHRVNEEPQGII